MDLTSADTEDGGETASTWSMAARILSEAESKEVVKKAYTRPGYSTPGSLTGTRPR